MKVGTTGHGPTAFSLMSPTSCPRSGFPTDSVPLPIRWKLVLADASVWPQADASPLETLRKLPEAVLGKMVGHLSALLRDLDAPSCSTDW